MCKVFTTTGSEKPGIYSLPYLVVITTLMLLAPAFTRMAVALPVTISQEPIAGIVRDSIGNPLEGVSVLVRGTSRGTATDASGQFQMQASAGEVLIFRTIGYLSQELTLGNQRTVNVVLQMESSDLDEVVVVGYGTTKRKDFTGSVGSMNLENSPVALAPNINVLESLKGSISGLNIGATNSAGGQPAMQIRGQNSINGENSPLIVLDGVIFMGNLSDINPNDIATIDVLKDATSAAAYGSRSANGVIAVTTKRGRIGKPVISFNSSVGFQEWQNRPEMLRAEEWIEMVNARNQYTPGSTNWLKNGELANREAGRETVWLDEISRTGVMQNYQAAISGASENINYYLSTSFDDNKSIIVGDQFNRIALMGKIKADVTKWLEVGVDAGFSKRDYSGVAANINEAQTMSPYGVMFRDDQGNLEKYPYTQSGVNPLWGVNNGTRDNEDFLYNYRLNTHAVVKVPWVEGLSYRVNYLINQDETHYGNFYYEDHYVQEGESPDRYSPATLQNLLTNANGTIEKRKGNSYVWDNILNFNRTFDRHSLDVTLVATRDHMKYERYVMTGRDFAANGNTALGLQGLHKATVQRIDYDGTNADDLATRNYERSNIGYLGRVNYSFDDTYYFTGSYRRDGASVFGADNKWADFFGAGFSWRVTNEAFMEPVEILNDLKLKVSWGQNGNQGLNPYGTLSTVENAASGGARYEFSNTPGRIYYGLYQGKLGNTSLGWEKTSSWNAGFESAWLGNRIFADLDLYFAKTTDQIFLRNIPVMTGFKQMMTSMGQVNNTGIEATVRTINVQKSDLTWSTTLTFWKNFNKLVSLYGDDLDGDGREDDDLANGLFIGKSLGAIYGYEQIGIVQEDDTEYIELTGAAPGAPKYRDLDGQPGITAADRKILGYEKENFRLNFSSNLSYKNFGLYVMVTGTFGGNNMYVKSNPSAYLVNGTGRFNDNLHYIPYWTSENRSNVYPSALFAGDGRFQGLQSRGFVRIQDISLSYTFNQPWLSAAHIGSLKVFATAKNLATFADWFGGDPETGARIRESESALRLPVASTYSLGVNLSF
ncbi:SusC/RagA family TonB-linked outer membrane protein [Parapedobacter indicus]|uniref:TonB-linked outer membrane protein, SusC/RagA family n=1 Tax=Parapedobacter indicus TaxID=1477437 RepID=A0A1I3F8T5_9SPHI|nr:SusC/RagA family TonB-linked outer membrane protein [Parapedobacter indicus]PPL03610.1 TonB-linked SusC/RagA family outer membrane protein [Parapedobacter indicus]SFI07617.1 TonB-linked outer membrane protein, SusC/RagA family [Parapedobacter indicus]